MSAKTTEVSISSNLRQSPGGWSESRGCISCPGCWCETFPGEMLGNLFIPDTENRKGQSKVLSWSSLVNQWVYWCSLQWTWARNYLQKYGQFISDKSFPKRPGTEAGEMGLVSKSTCCSCLGNEFGSLHLQPEAHSPPVGPATGNPSSGLLRYPHTCPHTCIHTRVHTDTFLSESIAYMLRVDT